MGFTKTIQFGSELGGDQQLASGQYVISKITTEGLSPVSSGNFQGSTFIAEVDDDSSVYYLVSVTALALASATGAVPVGRNITLFSVFSSNSSEVGFGTQATIATSVAFARAMTPDGGSFSLQGDSRLLKICYGMRNNISNPDGTLAQLISNSPNGGETNALMMLGFLCNTLYQSLISQESYDQFLLLAGGGKTCKSYAEALQHLIFEPFTNVEALYNYFVNPGMSYAFPPVLPMPQQYTIALKFNRTGSENFMFAGAAFTVFDSNDRAWITNNFRAGTINSGTHCVVLESDGSPAPFSPITGGGLLGTGFGAAVNNDGTQIAFGNFGWGPTLYNPQYGSISLFKNTGEAISPPGGYPTLLSRVQGMAYDSKGNLWITSVGTQEPFAPAVPGTPPGPYIYPDGLSGIVVYPGGSPNNSVGYYDYVGGKGSYYRTFDVCIDKDDYAYVTNIGDKKKGIKSSVYKFQYTGGQIQYIAHWESDYVDESDGTVGYESFRQVAVNSAGDVFICGMSSNRIIRINSDLDPDSREYITDQIFVPWGITFDANDTLFVANFGEDAPARPDDCGSIDTTARLGVTMVPVSANGKGYFMTLPSGGTDVHLPNGMPLYGGLEKCPGVPLKCYQPLMRLTSTSIDRAGNLWAANNWKPSVAVDIASNPGGDGMVVFLGVARHPSMNV